MRDYQSMEGAVARESRRCTKMGDTMKTKTLKLLTALALSVPLIHAQIVTEFAGSKNAYQFYYGGPGISFPALTVSGGNGATGAGQSITLVTGQTVSSSGASINPISTNTPITVGVGPNSETVTPTAVSNCNLPATITVNPSGPNCVITATFNNLHGAGELVTSGTYGLQEAINRANGQGGGVVTVDATWGRNGGTNAIISAAAGFASVYVLDNRGQAQPYWTWQPSTLTTISAPTTLTSTTLTFTATPVGTWANSAYSFCETYVDALGGESACSGNYTATPTVNYTVNFASPAASTGAVGYRIYAGVTNSAGAFLLPITSAVCTLTTLETVFPACAIGSAAVVPTLYLSTTAAAPLALGVTNTVNPVPQSHTTFSYQPSGFPPQYFQTSYGPFGSGTIASATNSDLTPLGSFNLPTGFLNTIGRTVRIKGKINLTAGASSTLGIQVGAVWPGISGGTPVAVCNTISGFVFATHAYDVNFECTMQTNAAGATAVGSIMPTSSFLGSYSTATLTPVATDTAVAAVGSLGLQLQDEFTVFLAPLVAADTTVQLVGLTIEVVQ